MGHWTHLIKWNNNCENVCVCGVLVCVVDQMKINYVRMHVSILTFKGIELIFKICFDVRFGHMVVEGMWKSSAWSDLNSSIMIWVVEGGGTRDSHALSIYHYQLLFDL